MLLKSLDRPDEALAHLNCARQLSEQLGDPDCIAATLCNLGNVQMQLDPAQGLLALQQALELREAAVGGWIDS